MTVAFSVTYSGAADADDALAARHAVFLENKRRSELTPPGIPLLFSSVAELKASYLTLLAERVTAIHLEMTAYAKSEAGITQRFTAEQVAQIHASLVARLNAGESAASLVTDCAS